MQQTIPPPEERQAPEHPGFQIVRWLRPAGAVIVLLVSALFLAVCFSSGRAPIPGYTAPHEADYYARHLPELAEELNANVLPQVDDAASAAVTGDTVTVTIPEATFVTTRAAVLRYFDAALVTFAQAP